LLAQKAGKLGKQVVLSGWLYRTTCHIAARTRRGEQRRAIREQEAVIGMKDAHQDRVWLQIEPLLDVAMSKLDERDRDAIVLRYFENKSLKEVGAALGINDDAAQKRLSRAVEKLRQFFAQRGESVTTGSLIAAIGTSAIQTAPPSVLAAVSASVATLAPAGAFNPFSWSLLKPGLAAVAVLGVASALLVQRNVNQTLRAERDAALASVQEERDRVAALPPPVVTLATNNTELLRLRGELARLRAADAELTRLKQELAAVRQPRRQASASASCQNCGDGGRKTRLVSNLKQIGLGLRMIANTNAEVQYIEDGRLSEPVIALLGGTEQFAMKRFENVSLLVTDSATLHKLERNDPKRIVAHSATPISSPDGKWIRFYLLAEGRVIERAHDNAGEILDGTAP
jgi:RNA polymerase sigma factor (sigma-70 family)